MRLTLTRLRIGHAAAYAAGSCGPLHQPRQTLNDCLDPEAARHIHRGQTDDHKKAAMAFAEKSQAVFQGR